jgi:hypothetical protein
LSVLTGEDVPVVEERQSEGSRTASSPGGGSTAVRRLADLIGQSAARDALIARLRRLAAARGAEKPPLPRAASVALEGAPGTGRAALASLYARVLAEQSVIRHGAVLRVPLSQVPARWPEQPAVRLAAAAADAEGGVLLAEFDPPFTGRPQDEQEAVLDALTGVVGVPGAPVLVLSGGPDMLPVLRRRTRLASALAEYVRLGPYAPQELVALFAARLAEQDCTLGPRAAAALAEEFARNPPHGAVFGAHRLADLAAARCASREVDAEDLYALGIADPPPEPLPEPAAPQPVSLPDLV